MESNQSLRDRLAELNAQIPLLEAERERIQQKLRSITYPVLALPPEMTSEIFLHCLPDLQHADPIFWRGFEGIPIPLLLSQICRVWRDIALNTPKLWAIFRIQVERWPRKPDQATLRLAEWLEKANLSSLSFIFERQQHHVQAFNSTRPPPSPAMLAPILALSPQWQNVILRLPYKDLITRQFQSGLHGKLPSLERLEITPGSNGVPPADTTVLAAFELAPSLRRVVLSHIPPTMVLLPWNQLTHFRGWGLDYMHYLHILRLSVTLVECKLGWVHEETQVNEPALLPCHPALEVFHFRGSHATSCCSILGLATFPSLVELDFHDDVTSEQYESFVGLLSRSRPPLLRLSLYAAAYLRILHGLPFLLDLAALEISNLTVAEMTDFLHNLAVRDPASFLPNLESFKSSVCEEDFQTAEWGDDLFDIDYMELADALKFRWNRADPLPRLRSFRMTWMALSDWDDSDSDNEPSLDSPDSFNLGLPRLRPLIEEGMHISVRIEIENPEGTKISAVWI
ncbi:hypothetical protein C8R45DRAFT_188778 [Mycena sanguinolenta]|nr:hypothetical protein C8R45DRAFT_188778 [Mycena sanguinolenta]